MSYGSLDVTAISNRSYRVLRQLVCVALLLGVSQPAPAAILEWLGINVSDTEVYKEVLHWIDPVTGAVVEAVRPGIPPSRQNLIQVAVRTLVQVIDPAFASSIISGRVTFAFDPNEIVTAAGWYGEFGANPNLPAPPIGSDPDIALLQTAANAAMVSSGIFVDQANGRAVFEFNWGPAGFVPTKNMDAEGHFNFLGLYLAPQPGTSTSQIVFSPEDVLANGTNASTFLQCNSPDGTSGPGTCGVTQIPETSTWTLVAAGFLAFGVANRLRFRQRG
jgi:hypothetical protein